MEIGAIIGPEGTFLFTLPEESTGPVTNGHIQKHMIGWFWHGVNVLDYISDVQIKRFFLENNGDTSAFYARRYELAEEITREEARMLYEMTSKSREEREKAI